MEGPLCLSKIICRRPPGLGEARVPYLRSFVEGARAEEGALCLSKIICRGAPKLGKTPRAYLRSLIELGEAPVPYLRSFVEGPRAREGAGSLSKIILVAFWAFISLHFGLVGLHFLAFWLCGPSFPCILALWAFISLHLGLFGVSFWAPPHKLPKITRLPNVLTMDLSAP